MAISPVVLITGCSEGGIGFALCEEFAFRGCTVYATARRMEAMDGLRHERIKKLVLDVTDEANGDEVVKTIIEAHGRVDILVNNAGAMCPGPVVDISVDRIRRAFETNTFGPIRMAQRVIPHMAEHGSGLIINVGSAAGEIAIPWNGIYSGTKAALHLISDTLAYECKSLNDNIRVMLAVPGATRSNISNNAVFEFPENSLYKSFTDMVIKRINVSQGPDSLPAKDFARQVVAKALSSSPPLYMTLGGKVWQFYIAKWLPKTWVFWYLFRAWGGRK